MEQLVTVIVPVYNVGELIRKCIGSITSQTHKNLEIILVDDGTPDNSGSICDEYAAADSRITVIHKENGGVAEARNTGLDAMHGDYVCFIDGDDYVSADYIGTLLKYAVDNGCDTAACGHYRAFDSGRLIPVFSDRKNEPFRIMSGRETLAEVFYGDTCSASSCCKLYKASLFDNIRFKKYTMGEDSFTLFRLLLAADRVVNINRSMYYYYQRAESAMHRKNDDMRFYDYVRIYDDFEQYLKGCDESLYRAFSNRLVENNFYAYMKLRRCSAECTDKKKHIADNIVKHRMSVITDRRAKVRTRLACIVSFGTMKAVDIVYDIFIKESK